MELIKVKKYYKDAKTNEDRTCYNFYLKLDNGNMVGISHLHFESRGSKFSNYKELCLLAREVKF